MTALNVTKAQDSLLLPWCAVKARTGLYDVVTRGGDEVFEWYEFATDAADDDYPLRAVVAYSTGGGAEVCSYERNGKHAGSISDDCPDDLVLKVKQPAQLTEHSEKSFFVKVSTFNDDSTFESADLLIVKAESESKARFAAIDVFAEGEVSASGAHSFTDATGFTFIIDSVKEVTDQDAEVLKRCL